MKTQNDKRDLRLDRGSQDLVFHSHPSHAWLGVTDHPKQTKTVDHWRGPEAEDREDSGFPLVLLQFHTLSNLLRALEERAGISPWMTQEAFIKGLFTKVGADVGRPKGGTLGLVRVGSCWQAWVWVSEGWEQAPVP